eukprot:scaffold84134_cov48-Phaeocystis_antarctica.AAC.2
MRRGAQRVARGVGLAWVGGEGGTHDLAGLLIGEHVPHLQHAGLRPPPHRVAAWAAHPVTREHDEAILWPERVRRHVGRGGHEIGAEVRAERRVRLEASVADGARAGQEVLAVGCDDSAEGDLACRRDGIGLQAQGGGGEAGGGPVSPLGSAAPPGAAWCRPEEAQGGCTRALPRRGRL